MQDLIIYTCVSMIYVTHAKINANTHTWSVKYPQTKDVELVMLKINIDNSFFKLFPFISFHFS